jgi:hypothetical protein
MPCRPRQLFLIAWAKAWVRYGLGSSDAPAPAVNPADYPVSYASARWYLGDPGKYAAMIEARRGWHGAMRGVQPERRPRMMIPRGPDFQGREIYEFGTGGVLIRIPLNETQQRHRAALIEATAALRKSLRARLLAGEVEGIARSLDGLNEPWARIEAERWQDHKLILGTGRGGLALEAKPFEVRFRDVVGVSMDQAAFAYASADQLADIQRLESWGAADGLAGDEAENQHYGAVVTAARRALLDRLIAGALVATRDGAILGAATWKVVDIAGDLAGCLPGVLVRSRIAGDEIPMKAYRTGKAGRSGTAMPFIKEELRRRAEAGEMLPGIKAESVALLNWKQENHPNAEKPGSAKTIENNIRYQYNKYKRKDLEKPRIK